MSSQVSRFWTLNSLVGAFLDLFIAYFLLCGSTIAFFAGKFLGLFGLSLPSPCNGLFGIPNSDFKSLLVDYPIDKISSVQLSVTKKFPFDSVFFRIQNCNSNDGLNLDRGDGNGDGFRELEGEASCSSKSDARKVLINETDGSGFGIERERGFDMKGKDVLNYRVRGGFRRRRKGSLDSGKHSSVSSSPNWITCVDQESSRMEHTGFEGSSILSGANSCNCEADTPMVVKSEDRDCQDTAFIESGNWNGAQQRIAFDDDDKDNTISLLARELEEEQAARAALYVELEKERNAAATAADEAMAMILRLQEEKASIEMESRQYQRMIEEKSAYDEEEMNLLKEILLRREREKHFLEKEVEAYRQMIGGLENDQFDCGNIQDFTEDPDRMLHQLSMSIAKKKNSKWHEDVDLPKQKDLDKPLPEKTIAIVEEEQSVKAGDASNGNKELFNQWGETGRIYDVHVIDDNPKLSNKSNGNATQQQPSGDDTSRGFLRRLDKETDQNRGSSEMAVGLPPMNSKSGRRHSTSALDNERTKIDTEVEWLRERLRTVQEGRERLNFSVDIREKETMQLQLLDDITSQLREICMLREPRKARQASLPLPSSKGLTKKRRCRSVSSGPAKSS